MRVIPGDHVKMALQRHLIAATGEYIKLEYKPISDYTAQGMSVMDAWNEHGYLCVQAKTRLEAVRDCVAEALGAEYAGWVISHTRARAMLRYGLEQQEVPHPKTTIGGVYNAMAR